MYTLNDSETYKSTYVVINSLVINRALYMELELPYELVFFTTRSYLTENSPRVQKADIYKLAVF